MHTWQQGLSWGCHIQRGQQWSTYICQPPVTRQAAAAPQSINIHPAAEAWRGWWHLLQATWRPLQSWDLNLHWHRSDKHPSSSEGSTWRLQLSGGMSAVWQGSCPSKACRQNKQGRPLTLGAVPQLLGLLAHNPAQALPFPWAVFAHTPLAALGCNECG